MLPIIYPATETDFNTRGYGALADCVSCAVTEVLNGEYTLELRYPKNGIHQEYLLIRNIIVCSANSKTPRQAFRIYKVNRSLKNSITVYANQLAYDLSGYPAIAKIGIVSSTSLNLRESAPNGNIIEVMDNGTQFQILETQTYSSVDWYHVILFESKTEGWCQSDYVQVVGMPITVDSLNKALTLLNVFLDDAVISTDKTSTASFTLNSPNSVRSWFAGKEGSLLDIYGGEWAYDFKNCQLLNRRGSDNGARISQGVNIVEYLKESTENAYSEIIPYYWKESEDILIEVDGSAIPTGFREKQRTLFLDVTDKFTTDYGVTTILDLQRRNELNEASPNNSYKDISDSIVYYTILGTNPNHNSTWEWGMLQFLREDYPDGVRQPYIQIMVSQADYGVGIPVKVNHGINYRLDYVASEDTGVSVAFVKENGAYISYVPISQRNNEFIAPSGATYAVLVFYATQANVSVRWNNIQLTSRPTVEAVEAQGNAYLNGHSELNADKVTYSIEPSVLNTEADLGDTVHVYYEDDIIDTRVVKTVWDVLTERYTKLELGTVRQNIAQTIKSLR